MDEAVLQEVFEELFQSLETAETQSAAVLQFLKAKGIANDEDFGPYFEQASKASSVRLVATRARIKRLLSAAAKQDGENNNNPETTSQPSPESAKSTRNPNPTKEPAQETDAKNESANAQAPPENNSASIAEAKLSPEETDGETQDKPRKQTNAA